MHFVLTRRVVRFARDRQPGDRFAARHDNRTFWSVSGPFARRALADRAAAGALATHTCLAAQVLDAGQLAALAGAYYGDQPDAQLQQAARDAARRLLPKAEAARA